MKEKIDVASFSMTQRKNASHISISKTLILLLAALFLGDKVVAQSATTRISVTSTS